MDLYIKVKIVNATIINNYHIIIRYVFILYSLFLPLVVSVDCTTKYVVTKQKEKKNRIYFFSFSNLFIWD